MTADTIRLVWIDDTSNHKNDADDIHRFDNRILAEFYHPVRFRAEIRAHPQVDIFLIDYILSKEKFGSESYYGGGLSYLGLIRENFPDLPAYLYSGDKESDIFKDLKHIAEEEADRLLTLGEIQSESGRKLIYLDALDYRRIRNGLPKGFERLIELLAPPDDEEERKDIGSVIPENLKNTDSKHPSAGLSLDFARFVRNTFLGKPGFLYNSLYASTTIGMTEEAFLQRKADFQNALYKGIFSQTCGELLWWKSLLHKLVFKKANMVTPERTETDVRELSRKLFSLKVTETAKCVVCGGLYPDTVGEVMSAGARQPVHFRCSREDPQDTKRMFFDDLRLVDREQGE